ncbi:MAG: glycoside hydrolase family 99-like domain-containing protein [Hyphomonas sp.]
MRTWRSVQPHFQGVAHDYHELVRTYVKEPVPGHTRFRGLMPSWDNTARRQNVSYVFQNASPGAFQAWLEHTFAETRHGITAMSGLCSSMHGTSGRRARISRA